MANNMTLAWRTASKRASIISAVADIGTQFTLKTGKRMEESASSMAAASNQEYTARHLRTGPSLSLWTAVPQVIYSVSKGLLDGG